jgi:hypothetical protein
MPPCPTGENESGPHRNHDRTLESDEFSFVLTRHWRKLGLAFDRADFTDAQAIPSTARNAGGNFRRLHRLLVQNEGILKIGGLSIITGDVVDAARSALVISRSSSGEKGISQNLQVIGEGSVVFAISAVEKRDVV